MTTEKIRLSAELLEDTVQELEKENARLRAAVEVAEGAHLLCIDELMEAHGENARLGDEVEAMRNYENAHAEAVLKENKSLIAENAQIRAALFCSKCNGTGRIGPHGTTWTCHVCGPLREQLREVE